MSTVVEQLTAAASLEKKAYFDYVKSFSSSSITSMVRGGVALEKAAAIVKEACVKDATASKMASTSSVLEKASEYIQELENKVASLEKFAEQAEEEKRIEESTPLNKLASIGFTKEEIAHIGSLPENLIEKMASFQASPTWEMGSGVGISREKTDPLLEFLLG